MGYRRTGKKIHADRKRWKAWCLNNEALIEASGLPSDVIATEDDWWYFIEHTYSRAGYHKEAPWFTASDLTQNQAIALWSMIKSSIVVMVPDHEVRYPNWLKSLEKTYNPLQEEL